MDAIVPVKSTRNVSPGAFLQALGLQVFTKLKGSVKLRLAELSYNIYPIGQLAEWEKVFNTQRLEGIYQLGLIDMSHIGGPAPTPSHNRWQHMRDTTAIAAMVIMQNWRWFKDRERDAIVLLLAALTHDVMTPAWGDDTKSIDRLQFCEERAYAKFEHDAGVQNLCKKLKISFERLLQTVQGDGYLGELLNHCDRIAYLARDVMEHSGRPAAYQAGINKHLARYPTSLHIWRDVMISSEGVVHFLDAGRFRQYALLRAKMFEMVYTSMRARETTRSARVLMLGFMLDTGRLTPDVLLTATNQDMIDFEQTFFNFPMGKSLASYPTISMTGSREWLLGEERRLVEGGRLLTLALLMPQECHPGTNVWVSDGYGALLPYGDVDPQGAEKIAAKAKIIMPNRLYAHIDEQPPIAARDYDDFERWRILQLENTARP